MTTRDIGARIRIFGLIALCAFCYALGVFIVPFELFLLGTAFILALFVGLGSVALLHRFGGQPPAITLPNWVWTGLALIGILAVIVLESSVDSIELLLFGSLVVFFGTHLIATGIETVTDNTYATKRIPLWGVGAILSLMLIGGVGRYLYGMTAFELLLLTVFIALTTYVGFIVPIGLLELARNPSSQQPEPPLPDVSIIIPAYNESEWIEACIESALAVTYPREHLEVLVIDDGSTDDTHELASQYRDAGVRVLQRPNGGRAAARNYGFFASNGDILVTLDADSLLDRDAVETIVAAFQHDPELGGVAGDLRVLNHGGLLTNIQAIEYVFSINTFRRACSFFNAVPVVPGCLAGFRREALEGIYWFDPDTETEDFDATLELLREGWDVRQVDAIARTAAPPRLRDLYWQRIRWYTGTLECIIKHLNMYEQRSWGYLHMLIFPLVAISYVFRPIAGAVILTVLGYGLLITGTLPVIAAVYFFAIIGVAVLATAVALETKYRHVPWYVFLLVGYRQFIDFVFLRSMVDVTLTPAASDGKTQPSDS